MTLQGITPLSISLVIRFVDVKGLSHLDGGKKRFRPVNRQKITQADILKRGDQFLTDRPNRFAGTGLWRGFDRRARNRSRTWPGFGF
jgi:hypothetical protein